MMVVFAKIGAVFFTIALTGSANHRLHSMTCEWFQAAGALFNNALLR
jgi:hypothetical protein